MRKLGLSVQKQNHDPSSNYKEDKTLRELCFEYWVHTTIQKRKDQLAEVLSDPSVEIKEWWHNLSQNRYNIDKAKSEEEVSQKESV